MFQLRTANLILASTGNFDQSDISVFEFQSSSVFVLIAGFATLCCDAKINVLLSSRILRNIRLFVRRFCKNFHHSLLNSSLFRFIDIFIWLKWHSPHSHTVVCLYSFDFHVFSCSKFGRYSSGIPRCNDSLASDQNAYDQFDDFHFDSPSFVGSRCIYCGVCLILTKIF